MSTFVIQFIREAAEGLHGYARHVGSGEEISFTSYQTLYSFIEEMRVLNGAIGDNYMSPGLEDQLIQKETEDGP